MNRLAYEVVLSDTGRVPLVDGIDAAGNPVELFQPKIA
jgi:hypothetical protein